LQEQFASTETPTLGHPSAEKNRNPESQNQKPLPRNRLPPSETELATRRERESPLPMKTASEREKKEGKKRASPLLSKTNLKRKKKKEEERSVCHHESPRTNAAWSRHLPNVVFITTRPLHEPEITPKIGWSAKRRIRNQN
ncbi:hypothetical protein VIGAN_08252600, partial [Vigna angularis var. angularis]